MNVSLKSILLFLQTNLFLTGIGILESISFTQLHHSCISVSSISSPQSFSCFPFFSLPTLFYVLAWTQFILLLKNYVILKTIDIRLQNKKNVVKNLKPPQEEYLGEFSAVFFISTSVESITLLWVHTYYFTETDMRQPILDIAQLLKEILLFIPHSFVFELVFDFFHYWFHRLIHQNKWLYTFIHKKHHKFHHPTSIITYYQDPQDLILTNSIPIFLTLSLIPRLSFFQYHLWMVYKTYIEISGHTGKQTYPNHSFPQFVWLPRYFNIELYSEDHDQHHCKIRCNYSKRFVFWDKLFGTYIPNEEIKKHILWKETMSLEM